MGKWVKMGQNGKVDKNERWVKMGGASKRGWVKMGRSVKMGRRDKIVQFIISSYLVHREFS